MEKTNSRSVLEKLTELNPKWFKYKKNEIKNNLALLFFATIVLALSVYVIQNILPSFIEIFEFNWDSPRNQITKIIFIFLILFFIVGAIMMVKNTITSFSKALRYKRKGVKGKKIYFSKENIYTPFKYEGSPKNLPEVIPIDFLEELPEIFPKNILYFCNNIEVTDCIIEGGYFGLVADVNDEKIILWKKINSCLSEFEKSLIQATLSSVKMFIYAPICQKKTKERVRYYELYDWGDPVNLNV